MAKCAVCGKKIDESCGGWLTLKAGCTPLSLSAEAIDNFGIKNLSFYCGNKGCEALVCYQCISNLERQIERKFLSKRDHLICPKCGKIFGEESFGEGGATLLLEGWKPQKVHMTSKKFYGSSPHTYYVFALHNEFKFFGQGLTIPTSRCCVCMSEDVHQVRHLSIKQRSDFGEYTMPYKIPLCKMCFTILTHPAIESPGIPYKIWPHNPRSSTGLIDIKFANPDFMDFVKLQNPFLQIIKF